MAGERITELERHLAAAYVEVHALLREARETMVPINDARRFHAAIKACATEGDCPACWNVYFQGASPVVRIEELEQLRDAALEELRLACVQRDDLREALTDMVGALDVVDANEFPFPPVWEALSHARAVLEGEG